MSFAAWIRPSRIEASTSCNPGPEAQVPFDRMPDGLVPASPGWDCRLCKRVVPGDGY